MVRQADDTHDGIQQLPVHVHHHLLEIEGHPDGSRPAKIADRSHDRQPRSEKRYTPAWQQYRISREVDRSNWHLLTGIKYWTMDEHILHDFKIVRLNANGEIEKEITDYGDEPEYLLQ